jgi:hypothetical protein
VCTLMFPPSHGSEMPVRAHSWITLPHAKTFIVRMRDILKYIRQIRMSGQLHAISDLPPDIGDPSTYWTRD